MGNKFLQEFKIPFVGMQKKLYQFEYLISETFFNNFAESDIEKCAIEVKLDLDKRENFFLLNFYIDGSIQTPCDRCTEDFQQEIFGDFEVAIKFGTPANEDSEHEDIVYISKSDDFIDVSGLIYEFIVLSIPLRSVHPNDKQGNSSCNEDILKKMITEEEASVDPRWAALEKLKNKKID